MRENAAAWSLYAQQFHVAAFSPIVTTSPKSTFGGIIRPYLQSMNLNAIMYIILHSSES